MDANDKGTRPIANRADEWAENDHEDCFSNHMPLKNEETVNFHQNFQRVNLPAESRRKFLQR